MCKARDSLKKCAISATAYGLWSSQAAEQPFQRSRQKRGPLNSTLCANLHIKVLVTRLSIVWFLVLLLFGCGQTTKPKAKLLDWWYEVKADKFFTFSLPQNLPVTIPAGNPESAWGSTYANEQMTLYAQYSSYGEEVDAEYAAKQAEYKKEITNIDGRRAKIQSWRLPEENWGHDYKYYAGLVLYDQGTGKQIASMRLLSKQREGIDLANEIFKTIKFQ